MGANSATEIRAAIESRIAQGELAPGDQLPSVRSLADELSVSPATVSSAYRDLRLRGMVVGRGRQGTRVAPSRIPEQAASARVPDGLVDAVHGSPDPELLPDLAPALAFAATLPQPQYGSELIAPRLADAARHMFEADGIDATHLAVTSGAMDAVERVLQAVDLRLGDRIGVEDPGHVPVHQIARSSGLELARLDIDEFGVTPSSLDRALKAGVRAVVLTPRAQNPTGAAFTAERAAALSKLLKPHPTVAVLQDDHAGLIAGTDYFPVTPPGPRWATMRSLGKSMGPDVRVALVVGDEQTMHRVATGISNGPGWVSYILQRATAHLLTDKATMQALASAKESYAARRRQLIDALAEQGVTSSGASGLNVWVPTPQVQQAIEAARDAGYAIRSAATYRIASPPAVRITISGLDSDDIDALAKALSVLTDQRVRSPAM